MLLVIWCDGHGYCCVFSFSGHNGKLCGVNNLNYKCTWFTRKVTFYQFQQLLLRSVWMIPTTTPVVVMCGNVGTLVTRKGNVQHFFHSEFPGSKPAHLGASKPPHLRAPHVWTRPIASQLRPWMKMVWPKKRTRAWQAHANTCKNMSMWKLWMSSGEHGLQIKCSDGPPKKNCVRIWPRNTKKTC